MDLNIKDVRAEMPNYENYKDWQRNGEILGIAVHHSTTVDHITGAAVGNAQSLFDYHVKVQGLIHGSYNYVITGDGQIEYALDENIAAYHAGFKDPDNSEGLEYGQYWNNHYLAICVAGWFGENRTYRDAEGYTQFIPNQYTMPTEPQKQSLLALIQHLRQKYNIPLENVRGHRELAGNSTTCPGYNLDPAELRTQIRQAEEETLSETEPELQPKVGPGEHVLLIPDTDKYFNAAMTYIWKFKPDVSFAVNEARGRWRFVTVIGNKDQVSDSQLARLRSSGAELVQHIPGEPRAIQDTLDKLIEADLRFLTAPLETEPQLVTEPQAWETYTVQPGDTFSVVARQVYGQAQLWRLIFEANRDILNDPGQLHPGQILRIPPKLE